jgi:glutamate-1-semialdehyde 2,1-aminomutase
MSASDELFRRAEQVMPGGVSSPVRAFRAVGGTPRVFRSGAGAWLTDVDGKRYVDLQMAFGPLILGHAHPAVVAEVTKAAIQGLAFGAPNPTEIELAEETVRRHPALEWVRFVNSGTEAVMSAARLARAYAESRGELRRGADEPAGSSTAKTGRSLLVKFDGGYHGHADAFLSKAGSGLATFGIAASAGVPPTTAGEVATLPLDDEAALEGFFAAHGDKVAAAFIEGVPANNGLLPQRREWHRKLRKLTRDHGALLVVDEVITGFRLAWGGATEALGLEPDIVTLGKVMGGGMPVGAYGGRRDLMQLVAPLGPVYQAGTLSGNPVAMAAGLATLRALADEKDAHARLERSTARLARALSDHARDAKFPLSAPHLASLLWVIPQADAAPRDATPLHPESVARFAALHRALLEEGVFLPPSAYEVAFLSTAHTDDVLRQVEEGFARALRRVRA